MIKAFVFDWGDVLELIDNESFIQKIVEKYNLNKEEFKKFEVEARIKNNAGEISDKQYVDELNKKFNININKKEFFETFFEEFVKENKELLKVVKKLKDNYKIFILTNNNEKSMEYIKKSSYAPLVDKVFNSHHHKMRKPDPKFFTAALNYIKIPAEECIFVDDKEINIKAAKELGFRTVHYKSLEDFVVRIAAMGIKLK